MLSCLLARRRIGAYLDGALQGPGAASTASHLAGCGHCRRQTEELRRLRARLQHALTPIAVADPDWTGFWPGIVRGIEDGRHARPLPRVRRWRPKWALSGALAAVLLASATFWQFGSTTVQGEPSIVVSSADTEYPHGSVMVYSPHEQNLAVVWIFGIDD
ncbi:MAG: hypothetical protein A3I14_03100 [Candidatus Rokubacteria bacterium RIFCSPLOWO2_02_FULL_73_56]|nr:MAG: hypothetical protein A3D33_12890 [Candidatus Rokubacteria bacterium RIFCSPHIGHO2_02_FULL_73_26]OGL08687.1 MAG: hypothetical protein A3I14_03100 [Candidatus Rokubacteria bacterium RIFCSPLOWO2_02_FULL_73_56]OGL25423.1 MAG: hypothetical protein A3G44_02045 [Candidatus Rokubacteria bacterium RIFCSPLOWO2_12_FULL_73_47]